MKTDLIIFHKGYTNEESNINLKLPRHNDLYVDLLRFRNPIINPLAKLLPNNFKGILEVTIRYMEK